MTTSRLQNIKTAVLAAAISVAALFGGTTADAASKELLVAGGCFWCVEADFEKVKGVKSVVSGFTGGSVSNPTYKQVTKGGTGHYEAVKITYDSNVITPKRIYDLFFRSVDPTDAGGQFCDRGDSYRTAIFVSGQEQRKAAEAAKGEAQAALGKKIVTPILAAKAFYPADAYHQDYYKDSSRILTRFGPLRKSAAYKKYRASCGRDARVKQLWGGAAPFTG